LLVVGRGLIEDPGIFWAQIRLAGRSGVERRSAGGELEAFEDLTGQIGIFDGRDEAQRRSATRALKGVDLEDTL
jgi:hypothetical protein